MRMLDIIRFTFKLCGVNLHFVNILVYFCVYKQCFVTIKKCYVNSDCKICLRYLRTQACLGLR